MKARPPALRQVTEPAKGLSTTPAANASHLSVHRDFQRSSCRNKQTFEGPTKRFVVCEERNRRMTFLGIAPATSPEEAIAIVRRYAMRGADVRMSARPFKITKK